MLSEPARLSKRMIKRRRGCGFWCGKKPSFEGAGQKVLTWSGEILGEEEEFVVLAA